MSPLLLLAVLGGAGPDLGLTAAGSTFLDQRSDGRGLQARWSFDAGARLGFGELLFVHAGVRATNLFGGPLQPDSAVRIRTRSFYLVLGGGVRHRFGSGPFGPYLEAAGALSPGFAVVAVDIDPTWGASASPAAATLGAEAWGATGIAWTGGHVAVHTGLGLVQGDLGPTVGVQLEVDL